MARFLKGVIEEPLWPLKGELEEEVIIIGPAIVLENILAKRIYVENSTRDHRIITSSLFGDEKIVVGENAIIVGNAQSNGEVVIRKGATVLGHVIGRSVEIKNSVSIVGCVIGEKVIIEDKSKIGGYVTALRNDVVIGNNVEVFGIIGMGHGILGENVSISDYVVYCKNGVKTKGKISFGDMTVRNSRILTYKASLNVMKIIMSKQYDPEKLYDALRSNFSSIINIKTYLEKHKINLEEIRKSRIIDILSEAFRRIAEELLVAKTAITISNIKGHVALAIGRESKVIVIEDKGNQTVQQIINLVDLFQKARESIREGDVTRALSLLKFILEIGEKLGKHIPDIVEAIRMLEMLKTTSINGKPVVSDDIKRRILSLIDISYSKMLKT